jgi:predicted transcriptional regulator of viral defense system
LEAETGGLAARALMRTDVRIYSKTGGIGTEHADMLLETTDKLYNGVVGRVEAREAIADVAAGQAGLFTAEQAFACGYTYQDQHYHYAVAKDWLRSLRGIYRLSWWRPEATEELVRWSLWSAGEGVISHDSAAQFHRLGEIEARQVHLTVPRGFRRRLPAAETIPPHGGRVLPMLHRAALNPRAIEQGPGFRVTTPLQTLVDLADEDLEAPVLSAAFVSAIERGLVTAAELLDALNSPEAKLLVVQTVADHRGVALRV